ncbi:hypothetical protein FHX81_1177 [Saccharothrix saharensis]|uniref:Uncharacterized protein n=1 Tax=Saccharothrix saharensis TaxID=571190 RepID=A0A543J7T8_9PSEU|nr:hypothetical protein [Saccharothrix saharensis]TQM78891.1 hypothetical protein FHX81_1177 [Saccharothrix saharensis]
MSKLTLEPREAVDKVAQWVEEEQPLINEVIRFAGDWGGWAHNQFATWLQRNLRDTTGRVDPLDVITEVGQVWTGQAAVPVFQRRPGEHVERADLVFNVEEDIGERAPALIVMQLRCETATTAWTDYHAALSTDVALLHRVDPALLPDPASRGRVVMALGIGRYYTDHDVAPGFTLRFAGGNPLVAVQWWSGTGIH